MFFAIDGAHQLSALEPTLFDTAALSLPTLLRHLLTFQVSAGGLFSESAAPGKKRKASVLRSALALQAVARLLTLPHASSAQLEAAASAQVQALLSDFVASAKTLLAEQSGIGGGAGKEMVSFSESLTATATVVEAVHALVAALPTKSADAALTAQLTDAAFVEKQADAQRAVLPRHHQLRLLLSLKLSAAKSHFETGAQVRRRRGTWRC